MRGKYLSLLVLILLASNEVLAKTKHSKRVLKRSYFSKDFFFGPATSAYQIEGGAHEGGRGPSIWDTFSEKHPEKIKDGSNGSIASNSYHLYKEDVKLLHEIGFNAYRFSISWSRILPRGNLKGGINQAGIDYYNNVTNELLSKGIQPFVTLFHWDVPQALEDAYGGFRSDQILADFHDFADICFDRFGDRVKHWMTINEPLTVIQLGYLEGTHAPGRCSKFTNPNCFGGDGATEPYTVAHNLILAHATAVKLYREKYNATQKGQIGLAVNSLWYLPYTETPEDRLAAARTTAFSFDFFMEPLVNGRYPLDMVNNVKDGRLLNFTEEESKMVLGSYDFIGINYYTSAYAMDIPCATKNVTMQTDICTNFTGESKDGVPIGPPAASDWLLVYPQGLRDLILYTKYKFKDPVMYITENGRDDFNTDKIVLTDSARVDFYFQHLNMVRDAISVGANVKGYFAWSLLDNYEWQNGYTVRFGLLFVDYKNNYTRYLKDSSMKFQHFLKRGIWRDLN